jgi:hypothetical protein
MVCAIRRTDHPHVSQSNGGESLGHLDFRLELQQLGESKAADLNGTDCRDARWKPYVDFTPLGNICNRREQASRVLAQ